MKPLTKSLILQAALLLVALLWAPMPVYFAAIALLMWTSP